MSDVKQQKSGREDVAPTIYTAYNLTSRICFVDRLLGPNAYPTYPIQRHARTLIR